MESRLKRILREWNMDSYFMRFTRKKGDAKKLTRKRTKIIG